MTPALPGTFAALSDTTRMAVIDLLSRQPRRAGDLASALEVTPAALSRHLRILRRSGLIAEDGIEEDARVRIYRLRKEPFDQMQGWLEEVGQFWGGQLQAFQRHLEKRRRNK
jgi:DNA-binding transcriptional ArsR family regulator